MSKEDEKILSTLETQLEALRELLRLEEELGINDYGTLLRQPTGIEEDPED